MADFEIQLLPCAVCSHTITHFVHRRDLIGTAQKFHEFSPPELCCPYHNRHCEPPSELCCDKCPEYHHGHHTHPVLPSGANPQIHSHSVMCPPCSVIDLSDMPWEINMPHQLQKLRDDFFQAIAEEWPSITIDRRDMELIKRMLDLGQQGENQDDPLPVLISRLTAHEEDLSKPYPHIEVHPRAGRRLRHEGLFDGIAPIYDNDMLSLDQMVIVRISPVSIAKTEEFERERENATLAAGGPLGAAQRPEPV